jgi:uncharacterized protein YegJ (DUF2314 family)
MSTPKPATLGFLLCAVVVTVGGGWAILHLVEAKPTSVVRINRKNPQLEAAINQARAGLDGFIKELSTPDSGKSFAVKAKFQTPVGPEYLWIRRPEYVRQTFSGILDQQPLALVGKNKGDAVSFPKSDVVDWLIKDEQGTRGEFTEKALGAH